MLGRTGTGSWNTEVAHEAHEAHRLIVWVWVWLIWWTEGR